MELINGDCMEVMKGLPDGSVDMILCDLPYGTTSCKWDVVLPFADLWAQYERLIRGNGCIALFAAEPFASALRMSNVQLYKYDWIWIKNNGVGFVNAKLKPINKHEVICIFSKGKTSNGNANNMPYYPQGLRRLDKVCRSGNKPGKENTYWRPSNASNLHFQEWTNYPTTILHFPKATKTVHPTQKPVGLLEYLIETYTREGETVLDNCMGSGSTGVAAVNTKRDFIGIESVPGYFKIAEERIKQAMEQPRLL